MSTRPHRIDVIRYNQTSNLYFIKYDSEIRNFLISDNIMIENEDFPYQFELDIVKLKEFVKRYEKNSKSYDKKLQKEIKDNDMIKAFKDEIFYAEQNNEVYLLYHIF